MMALSGTISDDDAEEMKNDIKNSRKNWQKRSHGVGLPDALIAATAERAELHLASCNLKHFPMFPNLKRPYPY